MAPRDLPLSPPHHPLPSHTHTHIRTHTNPPTHPPTFTASQACGISEKRTFHRVRLGGRREAPPPTHPLSPRGRSAGMAGAAAFGRQRDMRRGRREGTA